MSFDHLPEKQARMAEGLYEALRVAADKDLRAIAELLASKPDEKLFGETEFQLRDIVHRVGARALETAAKQRKKADRPGVWGGRRPTSPLPPGEGGPKGRVRVVGSAEIAQAPPTRALDMPSAPR